VTEGGFEINDEMKYEYLKKSILRSPNHIFNSILEYADYAELNEHRDRGNENGLNKVMHAMQIGSTSPENAAMHRKSCERALVLIQPARFLVRLPERFTRGVAFHPSWHAALRDY
jgi:hypothetical protein